MILTCPECSTRYVVDPKKLMPSGRVVRCAKCAHSWRESPPADDIPVVEDVAPPPVTETSPPTETPAAKASPPQDEAGVTDFDFPAQRNRPKRPRPARISHTNLPMVQTPKSQNNRWGWVSLIVFVGAIITGLLIFQTDVSRVWPPAAKLYEKIGLQSQDGTAHKTGGYIDGEKLAAESPIAPKVPSKPLDQLLKIHELTLAMVDEMGTPVLTIEGKISNIGDETVPLPPIKVEVTDSQRVTIREWQVTPEVKYLATESDTTFFTSLPNPPQSATDVRVTFYRADHGSE